MSPLNKFLTYKFFSGTVFYIPILLLFFGMRTESTRSVAMLVALYTVATALAEVPTGIIADSVGHKKTLILGAMCSVFATILLIWGETFIFLALAQGFIAFAISFRSGTEAAYLYSLSGTPGIYETFEGKASAINYVALGVASVLGSLLYTRHPLLPFALTLITSVLAVFILFSLSVGNSETLRRPSPLQILIKTGLNFRTQAGLFSVIFLFTLLLTTTGFTYWIFQLFLEAINFPVSLYGVVFGAAFVTSAVGSRAAKTINQVLDLRIALIIAILIPNFSLAVMGVAKSWWLALVLLVTQFFTGYLLPTLRFHVQNRVDQDTRATMLSLASILQRGVLTGIIFLFGAVSEPYGLGTSLTSIGIILFVTTGVVYTNSRNFLRGRTEAPLS